MYLGGDRRPENLPEWNITGAFSSKRVPLAGRRGRPPADLSSGFLPVFIMASPASPQSPSRDAEKKSAPSGGEAPAPPRPTSGRLTLAQASVMLGERFASASLCPSCGALLESERQTSLAETEEKEKEDGQRQWRRWRACPECGYEEEAPPYRLPGLAELFSSRRGRPGGGGRADLPSVLRTLLFAPGSEKAPWEEGALLGSIREGMARLRSYREAVRRGALFLDTQSEEWARRVGDPSEIDFTEPGQDVLALVFGSFEKGAERIEKERRFPEPFAEHELGFNFYKEQGAAVLSEMWAKAVRERQAEKRA